MHGEFPAVVQILYIVVLLQAIFGSVFGAIRRFPFGYTVFLAALAVHMILNLLFLEGIPQGWPELAFRFSYVYGPAFYLYIRSLCLRPVRIPRALLHFVPWSIAFVAAALELELQLLSYALPVHLIAYLGLATFEYVHATRSLSARQSQPLKARLRHVTAMLGVYGGVLLYDVIARAFLPDVDSLFGLSSDELTRVLVLVLINLMTIRQLELPASGPGVPPVVPRSL